MGAAGRTRPSREPTARLYFVAALLALRDLVLQHITIHRVVRQTETQLIFETRRGVGVLGGA